jgi:hypothetical protein
MTTYERVSELENGVPIPSLMHYRNTDSRQGSGSKYPFREMQIGQSIFVPVLRFTAAYWRDITGFDLTTRRVVDETGKPIGTRIWRLA